MGRKIEVQEGVVIVVEQAGQLLVIRRAAHLLAGGAWCFVGGAIEPSETQEEACVREFAEEVGGCIRPIRKVWEYTRPDGRLRLHWWLAELIDTANGELCSNPAEVAELRWCSPDDILALPRLLAGNVTFLREVWRTIAEQQTCRAAGGAAARISPARSLLEPEN